MTRIPANFVSSGWGIPTVCAKHGEPAVPAASQKKVQFISKPPAWSYALILLGALPFLIVVLVTRKTVVASAWPFCAQCDAARKRGLFITLGLVAAAIVAFLLIGAVSDSLGALMALLGLFLLMAGLIFGLRTANRALLAGGNTTADGFFVEFPKAHETFAAQANAAQQQAAAQQAPPQAFPQQAFPV
ncbi:hypothetical protein KOI35_25975 [Actinoplanes bogorensis]|uniref:Uncharacterized protein n=1 Tax=Paractinoplanes bogorensis TaxID=1610840 RepID=A0ABS5YW73_9ACTN|nr:hypothetical protein [Actinoplanes bogorensis]MBU2666964.1 hypothetical protein [Actinoplanes bogorensis]